jgi:hypothetical protein
MHKMNFYRVLVPCLLIAAILGCKAKKNYIMKVTLVRLTPDNIYDKKLVSDVIFDAQELHVDSLKIKSMKLFLKGVDLYKNKKNPDSAITVLKQSLLVFPEDITYYVLGNALMDAQTNKQGEEKKAKLREALQAYEVAENLNFQPVSQIYYNMACAGNMLGNEDSAKMTDKVSLQFNQAAFNLRRAFMSGFNDTNLLVKDVRINSILKTAAYKNMLAEMKAQKQPNKPETFFALYKNSFPEISQPFVISIDKVEMGDYKHSINFDYARFIPEMENTEFSRDVSHDYYYVGRLEETPLYTAVIYTSTQFDESELEPVYTKLVTYNPDGNIIDSRLISCSCTPEKAKTVRIENNIITTEDFKRKWKYPIRDEMGDQDSLRSDTTKNVMVKCESISKEVFKITEIGKIVPQGDATKVAMQ